MTIKQALYLLNGTKDHLNETERRTILMADPYTDIRNPWLVSCTICHQEIKLGASSKYDLTTWRRHQISSVHLVAVSNVSTNAMMRSIIVTSTMNLTHTLTILHL